MSHENLSPSVVRFVETVLRSGLLDRDRLRPALRTAPPAVRGDAASLAEHLVHKNLLSRYQANKLLDGVTRGLVLGPFQILAPLGRGGMGAVYLARDTWHNRLLALKVLPPKLAQSEARLLARFRREMELCRRVAHPVLTKVFGAGVVGGVHYIAMEFIPGQNLGRHVRKGRPLVPDFAARYFAEVADGLSAAHAHGLIHRDLKPSNLMVTPNGHAKILDLGLALHADEAGTDARVVGGKGYIVGTMDYMAPEQSADATAVDARTDLYSLGATIYFALSGRPPFPGGTRRQKIRRHRSQEPEPLRALNRAVPARLAELVERLMAKDPAARPPSARAVRQVLLPLAGTSPAAPPDRAPTRAEIGTALAVEPAEEASFDWAVLDESERSAPRSRSEWFSWRQLFGTRKK